MLPYPRNPPPQKYMVIPSLLSDWSFSRGNFATRASNVSFIRVRSSTFAVSAVPSRKRSENYSSSMVRRTLARTELTGEICVESPSNLHPNIFLICPKVVLTMSSVDINQNLEATDVTTPFLCPISTWSQISLRHGNQIAYSANSKPK